MMRRHRRLITALAAALGLVAVSALTTYAKEFTGWSAPVNLGPVVNSGATDG